MVIERVWLEKVNYVESVSATCHCVWDAEIVPLSEATRVVVWFQNQVVLKFVNLYCATEISRLKTRFEHQCLVVFEVKLVVRSEDLVVVTLVGVVCVRLNQLWGLILNFSAFFVLILIRVRSYLLVRSSVHTIIDNPVHEIFLVSNSTRFPSQTVLQNVYLRGVERL